MRIIGGHLKGREFRTPHSRKTHPMSDKARGALFNVLGDIDGLTFLDAFAGSGSLAFEAASRGAKSVTAIDKDGAAHAIIAHNIKDLDIGVQVHLIRANTGGWSIHNMQKQFDIVLLDPPYDDMQIPLLDRLIKRHVKPDGLAVLSYPGKDKAPVFEGFEVAVDKNYGDNQLVFYRKIK